MRLLTIWCPDWPVPARDDGFDTRSFEPVLAALERFAPRLEVAGPGTVVVPTRGPSRYFGGDENLAREVVAAVEEVLSGIGRSTGWEGHAHAGVADGRFAAGLAARAAPAAGTLVVPPGHGPSFLAPLPIGALCRWDPVEGARLADVLRRLGVPTLGAFAALAPADVIGRFGAVGERAHRLARGLDSRPVAATDPPPYLRVAAEVDPPADQVDHVAFVARRLAEEMHGRLAGRGLACNRVLVVAETAHGELLERSWRHESALDATAVADRVRWQIEGWLTGPHNRRPTAGVAHIALVPEEVVPATGRQLGFWGGETAGAARAVRAVARVQGLLGEAAVSVPERRGGRGPGEQVVLVPASGVDLTGHRPRTGVPPDRTQAHPRVTQPSVAPWPGHVPAPSPAVLHDPAPPVEVLDEAGEPVTVSGRGVASAPPARLSVDGGPWVVVEGWAGPWPVEERWWDPTTARRRARAQVVTAGGVAHLLSIEGGRWQVEATYD